MNKTAIKSFAIRARKKLIEGITQKAHGLGIMKNERKDIEILENGFKIKGVENRRIYKKYEKKQREKLISEIREKGFEQVIEEVAYTWFNRFIALRFMEVNGYLPIGVRVLSSVEEGRTEPDIIKKALNVDLDIDRNLVCKLIDANDMEDLYKYLIIKQCNQLGHIMPTVFEEIADYTELLLPEGLLSKTSVIRDLVVSIQEDDYKDQVEIIGWLYQYYSSEKKDKIFADLKKNKKIAKEDIPAATQLFTPKWIVRYMVENTLGRLWLTSHPDEGLKAQWKYYLEEAEQDSEVQKKLDELKNPNLSPEEIRVLDPAMGSGHILVYAFDVLYSIYLKANYQEKDIPQLILEKNLYGLDIDDRAGQLTVFALMMKARSKNKRIFKEKIDLNVCAIQESNEIPKEAIEYLINSKGADIVKTVSKEDVEYLLAVFQDAKEYGAILDVKKINYAVIEHRLEELKKEEILDLFQLHYTQIILEKLPSLIKQAKIMSQKYDAVIANPPYSGLRKLNDQLKKYIEDNFQACKYDLFSVFFAKNIDYTKKSGFIGLMTPNVWQYISSYRNLRELIINNYQLMSLIQLADNGFKDASVSISTFVMRKEAGKYHTTFIKLDNDFDEAEEQEKVDAIAKLFSKNTHVLNTELFKSIPDNKIAFWATEQTIRTFLKGKRLEAIAKPRQGMATSDNNKFLRLWHEVDICKIQFFSKTSEDFHLKWAPYNKGGGYRKWYGNNEFIINWQNNGEEVKEYAKKLYGSYSRTIKNEKFYFQSGITYTFIGKDVGPRFTPNGFIFDVAGSMIFIEDEKLLYILGLMASKLSKYYMDILNPTINIQVGDIKNIPVILDKEKEENIKALVSRCIRKAQKDWDSFETSWNFKQHPLLRGSAIKNDFNASKIETAFKEWEDVIHKEFYQMKAYEEELNKTFIEIYGLENELTPEVKEITMRRRGDIQSFISYAVGCMFGRYSLDEEGLIYAGGEFKIDRYKTFIPAKDNIIPIVEDDYFEDDIVNRFVTFVKITFGEKMLEENLDYIARLLSKKTNETSRQTIRRYFLEDFYSDHLKIYSKRPIYWLFDSGKENGFKALIYMHRYDVSTVDRIRTDYLHKLQKRYEDEVKNLNILIKSELPEKQKTAAMKRKEYIERQIAQCAIYDQIIAHIANQKIEIDLDDGVQVNYSKFQNVKISQGKELTLNLLARI
ncbi:restriction endonuclease [Clostridium formicaceticum]|nr:BREX-1 system adenine-specific DNA-methyltransferase PglX [Clostridium formicaceticum]AOY77476.1 restriction endonuclease [Clostridium formicaceticum]